MIEAASRSEVLKVGESWRMNRPSETRKGKEELLAETEHRSRNA